MLQISHTTRFVVRTNNDNDGSVTKATTLGDANGSDLLRAELVVEDAGTTEPLALVLNKLLRSSPTAYYFLLLNEPGDKYG